MEALRSGLHEHKENVEATISRGKLTFNELPGKSRTPGKLNPYSTPKSTKITDKQSSSTTKKPRRALGDISNQHRTPTDSNKVGGLGGKGVSASKLKANLKSTTPASAKKASSRSSSALRSSARPLRAAPLPEDVEEIEFAYGGLPSFGPDPGYLAKIRQEIVSELIHDKTPTIMDEYKIHTNDDAPTRWEPEMSMLSSGAAPSPWWDSDTVGGGDASFAETTTWSDDSIASTLDLNTPEPDDCSELPPVDASGDDGLLDEILNIDIPVSLD